MPPKKTELKQDPRNARVHTEENKAAVLKSMGGLGAGRSALVDKRGVGIAGNLAIETAEKLNIPTKLIHSTGKELIVIMRDDLDTEDPKRKALAIADNRTGDLSGFDQSTLNGLVEDLESFGGDMDLDCTGFSEKEREEMMLMIGGGGEGGGAEPPPAPEPPKKAKTEPGQMYQLGAHRLLCGDSTDPVMVKSLMDGEKADMVFTDPPYGLDGYAGRSGKFDALAGDDENSQRLYEAVPLDADNVFVWCEWKTYPRLLAALGEPRSLIVWNKNVFGMGCGYRRKHEFCAYWGNYKGTTESDVWDIARDQKYEHPTQKPVALAAKAITIHKPKTVLDLFGGSGSTLLACEQGRCSCRMMELDPRYCDVIVMRYCALKGIDPDAVFDTGVAE